MRLDCDDLKRGLISRANSYADRLLKKIADEYREENERFASLLHHVLSTVLYSYTFSYNINFEDFL